MTAAGRAGLAALGVAVALAVPRQAGADARAVTLAAPDGTPLAALLYEAERVPAPAVVLVHMLQRSKQEWRRAAEALQREGITALALDLRGHGGSGGAAAHLPAMVQDVGAALDWLAVRPEVTPGALGVAGASLGANLALLAAADRPAVRSAALLSPSTDYRGVPIAGAARRFGARPLLLVAGADDPLAVRTVRELAEDAQGVREQRIEPLAAHGTRLLERVPSLVDALVDWFRRTLLS